MEDGSRREVAISLLMAGRALGKCFVVEVTRSFGTLIFESRSF